MESAQKILKWVACSRRPLQVKELREGMAFNTNDKARSSDNIPDEETLLRSCRGLVIRDDIGQTIQFAHHTIKQYLVFSEEGAKDSERGLSMTFNRLHTSRNAEIDHRLTRLFFTLRQANIMAAEICVAYLGFSDFEVALAHRDPPPNKLVAQGIFSSTGPSAIPSAVGIRKPFFDVPYKFFGGHTTVKPYTIDYSKYLTRRVKRPTPDLSCKIRFAGLHHRVLALAYKMVQRELFVYNSTQVSRLDL